MKYVRYSKATRNSFESMGLASFTSFEYLLLMFSKLISHWMTLIFHLYSL